MNPNQSSLWNRFTLICMCFSTKNSETNFLSRDICHLLCIMGTFRTIGGFEYFIFFNGFFFMWFFCFHWVFYQKFQCTDVHVYMDLYVEFYFLSSSNMFQTSLRHIFSISFFNYKCNNLQFCMLFVNIYSLVSQDLWLNLGPSTTVQEHLDLHHFPSPKGWSIRLENGKMKVRTHTWTISGRVHWRATWKFQKEYRVHYGLMCWTKVQESGTTYVDKNQTIEASLHSTVCTLILWMYLLIKTLTKSEI